ncbi:hypothetical protein RB195_009698 [Necator americanus]|uniref:General transcription factor IIH subunit n=2 Tax=Necator americanus TaxID=51031 RepID=W2TQB3_NECAM|nr:transcription factor ssl1 [Necator americanus]ETN83854.1 transcription factor ssl1 [Necator americanus]
MEPMTTEDDDQKGYTWEAGYADGLNIREVLEEDEGGSIEKSIAKLVADARKKQRTLEKPTKIRLGIMRYVYVCIDCSRSMTSKVMPPSRFFVTAKIVSNFLDRFFEQNPIAQVGLILVKDKKAERFVSHTGNIRALKDSINSINEAICSGDFSLQNALQLALTNLKSLPGHVSREIIVIMASLSTVDPGNIFSTFEILRGHNIRCSVIGLSAELFVCKQLAKITNGRYDIVLDTDHMEMLLYQHTAPPPSTKAAECNAIRVAFPPHVSIKERSFCVCHPMSSPLSTTRGFLCEQCGARHCSLPAECRVCRLTLVAAPQLARAFRHLLPLPAFVPTPVSEGECMACERPLTEEGFACKSCAGLFCFDCDILLHESLHVCPNCL